MGTTSRIPEPEIIEGLGQFRAGRGAIVTEWKATRDEAIAAYELEYRACLCLGRRKEQVKAA